MLRVALIFCVLGGVTSCVPPPPRDRCPSRYQFTGGPAADADLGWSGVTHDQRMTSKIRLTLGVGACANRVPPCGTCRVSGPAPNVTGPTYDNRRCRGDATGANGSWRTCVTAAECAGTGNACVYFLGPPQPTTGQHETAPCTTNEIVGAISGTLDPTTGATAFRMVVRPTHYEGTVERPCPRCVGGTCDSGQRAGMACVINATSAILNADVSFDCPPAASTRLEREYPAAATFRTLFSTGTQTMTLTAAHKACTSPNSSTARCLCDTCNNAAATPCSTDAECVAVGASTCGGLRCSAGANAGAPCTTRAECPGGGCNREGVTQPNACDDLICTPNTPPDNDSVNEGSCVSGPMMSFCNRERFRACSSEADCPLSGDTCTFSKFRECFTDNGVIGGSVSVAGMESPVKPALGALFCAPRSSSETINRTFGLPGLGRITLGGTTAMR